MLAELATLASGFMQSGGGKSILGGGGGMDYDYAYSGGDWNQGDFTVGGKGLSVSPQVLAIAGLAVFLVVLVFKRKK